MKSKLMIGVLAALSMYMLAKRCQQNLKAPKALEQSIKSYLAAINSLSLLSQDKQWLSVPLEVSLKSVIKREHHSRD